MRRILSFPPLILGKFVFPGLALGALSYGLLLCWLGQPASHGRPLEVEQLCGITLLAAGIGIPILVFAKRLLQVAVDDRALYISNGFTEVRLPFSEIAHVGEEGGYKSYTTIAIHLHSPCAFGRHIEFHPKPRLYASGVHPFVAELLALRDQANGSVQSLADTPFDPNEKVFEAGDDCVQVGADYLLYGCEGKAAVSENDKFFFKDLTRVTVTRSRKSGRVKAIAYKAKGQPGTFEIGGHKPEAMEEIARLLETRARHWPIRFLEKQSSGPSFVGVCMAGLGAIAATICGGWLLHFGWTVRDQLADAAGYGLYGVICLGTLAVATLLWIAVWRGLRN